MKILFISNGHGEDIIAARIIKELAGNQISALPVVGKGDAFEGLGIEILGPRKSMPSGGFVYQSLLNMAKDVIAGLAVNTRDQINLLLSLKGKFDLVVAIGDIVPIVGALLTKTPFIFVGCAKSDHYDYSYTPWEKFLLKKYCKMSFPRDQKTTDNLKKYGIKAEYVGNPMMDCIETTGNTFGVSDNTVMIGVLPGTRDDAAMNLEDITAAVEEIEKIYEKRTFSLVANPANFGDVISMADIIIGLSGTGNEQAAGLGKPVVAFPGRGVQYTAAFAKKQTQLLGDALALTDRDPKKVAETVANILRDKDLYNKMSLAGKQRMGGPGASNKIGQYILQ